MAFRVNVEGASHLSTPSFELEVRDDLVVVPKNLDEARLAELHRELGGLTIVERVPDIEPEEKAPAPPSPPNPVPAAPGGRS